MNMKLTGFSHIEIRFCDRSQKRADSVRFHSN